MSKGQDAASVLLQLAENITGVADSLNDDDALNGSNDSSDAEAGLITNSLAMFEQYEPRMLWLAEAEYAARRARSRFIDSDILGEPAWDILLDLSIQRMKGKRVSVTSLCIASAVPATTGLRWIAQLRDQGLLERRDSEADKRKSFVQLTEAGWRKMRAYFFHQMNPSLGNVR